MGLLLDCPGVVAERHQCVAVGDTRRAPERLVLFISTHRAGSNGQKSMPSSATPVIQSHEENNDQAPTVIRVSDCRVAEVDGEENVDKNSRLSRK